MLPVLIAAVCPARQLSTRFYTTAGGLPRDEVTSVRADASGLIWFCTPEGLTRFDGVRFTTYSAAHGLPDSIANTLLTTRGGTYWVGTAFGIARFQPQPGVPRFWVHPGSPGIGAVEALVQDPAGSMWIASVAGLFRLANPDAPAPGRIEPLPALSGKPVRAIAAAGDGTVWAASRDGVFRVRPNGAVEQYGRVHGLPGVQALSVLVDRQGRVWVGLRLGLARMSSPDSPHPVFDRVFGLDDGLVGVRTHMLYETRDGHIWAGAAVALHELIPRGGSSIEVRAYLTAPAFRDHVVHSMAEDQEGNLWLATRDGGAIRLLRGSFETFTEGDGLSSPNVCAVFEDRRGQLHAINGRTQDISRFDGRSFVTVGPRYGVVPFNQGFRLGQIAFQARNGEWWIATDRGLFRFPRARRIEDLAWLNPVHVFGLADGLPNRAIFRIFEDSNGGVWIASQEGGLSRWDRATGSLRRVTEPRALNEPVVTGFAETPEGSLWIAAGSQLARYRHGEFTLFEAGRGPRRSRINALLVDRAGRLWLGFRQEGLGRIDSPGHPGFHVRLYSMSGGLSSNTVDCLAEDEFGRIYAGTPRGVDRLDPDSGAVRHYTADDGLFPGPVKVAHRDRAGRLWFGGVEGLSSLVPQRDEPARPPLAAISAIRVRGNPIPLSELGETHPAPFILQPSDNHVEIDFTGLAAASAGTLRYQYRLRGWNRTWSTPDPGRSVTYASLAPGAYRFDVRSVNPGGRVSEPAIAEFTVLAPLWRRPWFLAMLGACLAACFYGLHLRRLARVVEIERVRTRIATDLHDDIGSSLSQIAILSEVARRKTASGSAGVPDALDEIARTARELVDSMSDIVWAIDPGRDHMGGLLQRMRRFSEDLCGAADIGLSFDAPIEPHAEKGIAGAHLRRQVYLIFKESLNNAVRHSGCSGVHVAFSVSRSELRLRVEDNGRGFDPAAAIEGRGLKSIRERARRLGASVSWRAAGPGTAVELCAPLGRRRRHITGPHEHAAPGRA